MRLFVALNLPAAERTGIHRECAGLRERDLPIRWVRSDLLHVTLKFLGNVAPDRLPEVRGALESVARDNAPFEVELSGFGAFPTVRRPRVLWLGVEASPRLRGLKQDLERVMAGFGFEREGRAFHPHVTLGRARDGIGAGAFRGLDAVLADMGYASRVSFRSIDLMRSKLSPQGPEYSLVSSNSLGVTG
jgi:2'-5' RNA ligase